MAKKNVIEIMLAKFPIIFPVQNLAVSGKVCIFATNYDDRQITESHQS